MSNKTHTSLAHLKNDSFMASMKKRAQLVKSALLGGTAIEAGDFSSYADVRDKTKTNKANQAPINPSEEDFVEVDGVEPPHSVYEVIVAILPEAVPLFSSTNEQVKCFSVNLRGRRMRDKHCHHIQEAFTLLHRSIETSSPFKSTLPPNVSSPALQNEVDYYGSTDVLIRTMDIGRNFLTIDGLRSFIDTIALSREGEQGTPQTALKIRLDHNSLDDAACEYLAEIIKNPNSRLQSLDLSFNKNITDKGVASLCRALIAQQVELDTEQQPVKLKSLALVATGMTDTGLRNVLEAATINRHIHRLDCHRLRSTTEENPTFLDTHLLGELLTYMRRNRGEQIEYAISAREVPINDSRPDVIQSHTEKLIERSNSRLMSYQVMCSENGWRVERDVLESQIRRLIRENAMTKIEIENMHKKPVSRVRKATDTPVNIKQVSEVESLVDPTQSEVVYEDEPVATNAPHKIQIILRDKNGEQVDFGGQEFDINLLQNGNRLHREHYHIDLVDNFDGTYDVTYAVDHLLDKGKYELSICIAALDANQRKHIKGSPIALNVVNGPVPKLCQLTPMQENSIRFGKDLRYTIQLHDRNGAPVDYDQDGRAGNPSFQLFANRYDSYDPYRQELVLETQRIALDREHGSGEHLSGTYELGFMPDKPGMYVIDVLGRDHVTGGHEHLIGSPHLITVHPIAFGPYCRARGPALTRRQLRGSHKYFTIYAMDRNDNHVRTGGDKFTVCLKNKETQEVMTGAVRSPIDYNNGTYRVDLELDIVNKLTVGEYEFHAEYVGETKQEIFGSPFTVFMHSDDKFSPDQSGLDLNVGNMYDGLTHFFRIKCKNEKGQPIDVDHKKLDLNVKVTPPQGETITYKSSQISEFDAAKGELVLKWRPLVPGKYVLQIQMEDQRRGTVNVANCPFTFNVKASVESPSNTHTNITFEKNQKGAERTLYVMTRNHMNKPIGKGGDHVEVIVRHVNSGDEMKTSVKDLRNGSYRCDFELVFSGEYQVLVVINDQPPIARQCVF